MQAMFAETGIDEICLDSTPVLVQESIPRNPETVTSACTQSLRISLRHSLERVNRCITEALCDDTYWIGPRRRSRCSTLHLDRPELEH